MIFNFAKLRASIGGYTGLAIILLTYAIILILLKTIANVFAITGTNDDASHCRTRYYIS